MINATLPPPDPVTGLSRLLSLDETARSDRELIESEIGSRLLAGGRLEIGSAAALCSMGARPVRPTTWSNAMSEANRQPRQTTAPQELGIFITVRHPASEIREDLDAKTQRQPRIP